MVFAVGTYGATGTDDVVPVAVITEVSCGLPAPGASRQKKRGFGTPCREPSVPSVGRFQHVVLHALLLGDVPEFDDQGTLGSQS